MMLCDDRRQRFKEKPKKIAPSLEFQVPFDESRQQRSREQVDDFLPVPSLDDYEYLMDRAGYKNIV